MQRQFLLALAVKAMNDLLVLAGIVPSALVFGEFPSLCSISGHVLPRPSLAERAEAAQQARSHMANHLARAMVRRALHHNPLPATDQMYRPGDEVLVWREKRVENRIGEWLKPYTVVAVDSSQKMIAVQKEIGMALERYNVAQMKTFIQPKEVATSFLKTLHRSFSAYSSEPSSLSDLCSLLHKFNNITDSDTKALERQHAQGSSASTSPPSIQVTELIHKDDPRASSPAMRKATFEEVQKLMKRDTFKFMLDEELPDGANSLTARFVLAIKSTADGKIKYKAKYVIGGD